MRWPWNAVSLLPLLPGGRGQLPASVPGGAAAVLAQVSPGLADFGRKGYPSEKTGAREETVVPCVFAHPPHAADTWTLLAAGLHCTGRNQVRSAGQKG